MAVNVALRLLKSEDEDLLIRIEQSSEMAAFTTLEMPGKEELIAFLNSEHNFEKHGQLRFVITENEEAVGFVDLSDGSSDLKSASTGIAVVPERRGEGIAAIALKQLFVEARKLGIEKLFASIQPENEASKRTFEKAGYSFLSKDGDYLNYSICL
jgi:RimJ/RimL family protein N-acetyltransferase